MTPKTKNLAVTVGRVALCARVLAGGAPLRTRCLIPVLVANLTILTMMSAPALAKEGLGVVGTFGGPGSGAGELSLAPGPSIPEPFKLGSGVAVGDTGDVYVADTNNNRVEWFNAAGTKIEGEFNGSGKLGNEDGKQAPAILSKPEGIAVDDDPTSPSSGDVYVVDGSQGVVDKFSATGEFIFQLRVASVTGVAVDPSGDVWIRASNLEYTNLQEFDNAVENKPMTSPMAFPSRFSSTVAVDSEDNLYLGEYTSEVGKFTDTGTELGDGEVCGGSCNATGLAIDPTTNDLFIDRTTFIAQYGPFGEPFEVPIEASKPDTLGNGAGIAVSTFNHDVYVADAGADDVVVFAYGPDPEAPETLSPREVKSKSAVFRGKLSPHSTPVKLKYYFEYNTGSSCAGGSVTSVREGEGAVEEEVGALEPSTEYTYCLVAENDFGSESGSPVAPFSTPPAAPEVISESATNETPGKGVLEAAINPENQETNYSFEYSTEGKTGPEEALEGAVLMATGEKALPAEFGERSVRVHHVRMGEVSRTYYYRVVVINAKGEKTIGKVKAYTKLPIFSYVSASELTSTSAVLTAEVNQDFQETRYRFEYATGEHGKESLENGKGIVVPSSSGTLPENETLTLTLCKDGSHPTPSPDEQFTCDDGSHPQCTNRATPLSYGENLICPTPVSVEIVLLQPGETYYYRIVAENESTENSENANAGRPAASEIEHFKTYAAPTATTGEAQNITPTTATLSGTLNPEGAETTYYFEYVSEAGFQAALEHGVANPYAEGSTTTSSSAGAGEAPETVGPTQVGGLLPGTTYHYALVATNKFGARAVGSDATFTTAGKVLPTVTTGGASSVAQNSATLSGTVATNGLQTDYGFEIGTEPGNYGPATGLGSIGGSETEEVSVTLSELQPATTYYYRVTATDADGTSQGQPGAFTTPGFPALVTVPASPPLVAIPSVAFPKEETGSTGTRAKKLTKAQELSKALKQCKKDKSASRRTKCEAQARKRYGSSKAKKKNQKAHKK